MNNRINTPLDILTPFWSESRDLTVFTQGSVELETTIQDIVVSNTAAHVAWNKFIRGAKKAVVKFHRHPAGVAGVDLVARGGFGPLAETQYAGKTKYPSFIFAHGEEIEIVGIQHINNFRFKPNTAANMCWVSIMLFR